MKTASSRIALVVACSIADTPIVHGQSVIYTGAGRGTRALQIAKQGDQNSVALWTVN